MSYTTAILKIEDHVQGIGMRYSSLGYANKYGLLGWIRNQEDGTVICYLQNTQEQVRQFIEWLKETAFQGYVVKISLEWKDLDEEFKDFKIIY